jgi:acetyl-CoA decarbonylase/synthase complex subunit gamma
MASLIPFNLQDPLYIAALLFFLPLAMLWNALRRRKVSSVASENIQNTIEPLPVYFNLKDYGKALISWIFLFMRVFTIKPGLYYIGEMDENAPLLVTANNFLTVFLLARRLSDKKVRLLIIDTKGINVWCSAGEGSFSSKDIIEKATNCGLLTEKGKVSMILPKLSFAGVKLEELRKHGINPIIGPLYAKDVPAFLGQDKLENQIYERVHFGLQSRAFTALPTAIQFFYYFLGVYVITLGYAPPDVIWIATGLAFIYPLLFPWLPGKYFSVKGIYLALLVAIVSTYFHYDSVKVQLLLIFFLFATSIFIGLSYTGNSAVSNYTSVRKETARFLPVVVILYLLLISIRLFT